MLCGDGITVEWEHSEAPIVTVTSEHVLRLMSDDIVTRAVAHAELTNSQLLALYSKQRGPNAKRLRWLGQRIIEHGLEQLSRGIAGASIQRALKGRRPTRLQLIKQLVSCW
jgi:hypothetical protein